MLPVIVLTVLLAAAVYLFGNDSSYGPNQIGLLIAAALALRIGYRNGIGWEALQEAVTHGVNLATGAIFVLLLVGALIGVWILSGTVPTLIHYGLLLLDPDWFYAASCLVCALVGVSIGSSWTVAGTIGVALMGVAAAMGLSPAITAGAIVSGAYFGDKMSPLSDTTNLAPAVAGSELFDHIRQMAFTTLPAFLLALGLFAALGFGVAPVAAENLSLGDALQRLDASFAIGPHLLLPLGVVLLLAWRRVPAAVSLGAGIAAGAVFAAIFQPQATAAMGSSLKGPDWIRAIGGIWKALFDGYAGQTGHAALDELLNRGGMSSMLNTVWLIICAMAFGAAMEKAGLLQRLILGLMRRVRSAGGLVCTTILSAFGVNVITSDQYLSIVIAGRVYRHEFERQGLDPLNLSRAVEDGGTITSPLVPWNTCGAYMAATLGVATFSYAPWALFNWINLILALLVARMGWRLLALSPGRRGASADAPAAGGAATEPGA